MSDTPGRIDRTFQDCDICGEYFVNVASHQCSTGGADGTGPTREERVQRAAEDTHPDDEEGLPECGGGGVLDDEQWIRLPRVEAKA